MSRKVYCCFVVSSVKLQTEHLGAMLLSFVVAISHAGTYWRTSFHYGFHFTGFHSHIICKCLNIQHLNLIALKLYLCVAALHNWADCAFQKVRNEQALHEKASGKWQVIFLGHSWSSIPPREKGASASFPQLLPSATAWLATVWPLWKQVRSDHRSTRFLWRWDETSRLQI